MSELTRRQLLALGLAGAGTAAVGGAGLWWTVSECNTTNSGGFSDGGDDLLEPDVVASRDGVLDLELVAAPARVKIGGRNANV